MHEDDDILRKLRERVMCLQRGETAEPVPWDGTPDSPVAALCGELNRLLALHAEAIPFIRSLAEGNLDVTPPPRNQLASPFKQLHAALRHLAWQTGQIAAGDYSQRVSFMGEFSRAFNSMIEALEGKRLVEESLRDSERELRKALTQVAEEKAKSEAIIAAIGEGLSVHDRDFRIIYQNRIVKELMGDHLGEYCYQAYEHNDATCRDCPIAATFADGHIHISKRWIVDADGKHRVVENTAAPIYDSMGTITAVVELSRDITEQKEAETRIVQVSNLYEALSKTNRAIMYSRNPDALFGEICDVAVQYGKFCLAGVGMLEENGFIRTVAHRGSAGTYLDSITVSVDMNREEGQGPSGIAIREGRPYICNDFLADPVTAPWREAALANGICASATFPLKREGRPVGVLKVYSEQKGFFDDNILGLLLEMAENISFAIDNFFREEQRRRAEEALRESEERLKLVLEGSNDGFWDWNVNTGQVTFSRRYAEMLGFSMHELEPTVAARRDHIHPDDWPQVHKSLQEHLSGVSAAYQSEFRLRTKSGGWEWVLDRGRIVASDGAGTPLRMAGTTSIITQRKRFEEELNYMSTHDAMTGLFNRAYYDAELVRLAQSRHYPVSIVIGDLDGLKLVNDSFGHMEGDRLIKLAARALRDSFRPEDVVARIGGDEFAVLLPDTDASTLKEAVKRVLKNQAAINEENREYTLSISVGSATAERSEQLREAVHLADSRMYYYKFQRKSQPQ